MSVRLPLRPRRSLPPRHQARPQKHYRATGQGALAGLRDFFAANPDEELTYEQARVKFGCMQRDLTTALGTLKARGEVEVEVVRVIRAKRDNP